MLDEEFVDLKGYEGIYQINRKGEIKSLARVKGTNKWAKDRILKQHLHSTGCWCVNLVKDKIHKVCRVHRLLAETFIPNPNNLPYVNHKDEDRTNYSLDTLEWCNNAYNLKYSHVHEKNQQAFGHKIKVTNVKNGEEFIIPSKREFIKHFKTTDVTLKKYASTDKLFRSTYKLEFI